MRKTASLLTQPVARRLCGVTTLVFGYLEEDAPKEWLWQILNSGSAFVYYDRLKHSHLQQKGCDPLTCIGIEQMGMTVTRE